MVRPWLALSPALATGVAAGLDHVRELFDAPVVVLRDLVVLRCSALVHPLKRSMALARPDPVPTYCLSAISW